jgi:MFS family permease
VHERWRDARYRSFMFFYTLLVVASTNAPFMVAGARAELGASARELGLFVPLYLVALTVSGPLLGRLADRCGFRLVGVVCGLLLTSSFLLCLVSDSLRVWYVAFTLYAACPFAAAAVLANLSAELCPGVPASRLIAVGNVMVIGFVVAGSALCGAVIDATGSYPAIFTANLVIAAVATAGFLFVVRVPRRLRAEPYPRGRTAAEADRRSGSCGHPRRSAPASSRAQSHGRWDHERPSASRPAHSVSGTPHRRPGGRGGRALPSGSRRERWASG